MANTTVFRNANWTKRDYECTNIVACVAQERPARDFWVPADESILQGLQKLWIERDVQYWGYL